MWKIACVKIIHSIWLHRNTRNKYHIFWRAIYITVCDYVELTLKVIRLFEYYVMYFKVYMRRDIYIDF